MERAQAGFEDLLSEASERYRSEAEWDAFIGGLAAPVRRRMLVEWGWQAHEGQAEPDGDWRVWLMMAGRGFGKTLAGAQWVAARARAVPEARIALVGATLDEVAKVMIEGPSGLLAVAEAGCEELLWLPTRGTLRFPSGAEAHVYSAEAGERLRGPEHHFAWCDELSKWERGAIAWDNLTMGLRAGAAPRCVVTTTPRPTALLRRVLALPGTKLTGGPSAANVHLAQPFLAWMEETYGGTRLGRQELEGVLLGEPEGALFPRAVIEAARAAPFNAQGDLRALVRVVVGVDPPASAGGDACGISVCGLGADGLFYVLDDRSVRGLRPEGWARAVARAAADWGAARVVAETNQGGEMVESVLRGADCLIALTPVTARRGKAARAEPVAALFESRRARIAGRFAELEEELAGLSLDGGYDGPGQSPDRADAMVWAMDELMRGARRGEPRVRGL